MSSPNYDNQISQLVCKIYRRENFNYLYYFKRIGIHIWKVKSIITKEYISTLQSKITSNINTYDTFYLMDVFLQIFEFLLEPNTTQYLGLFKVKTDRKCVNEMLDCIQRKYPFKLSNDCNAVCELLISLLQDDVLKNYSMG